ncbi:hypothetical protein M885DRAFT_510174 [Pelagophyceae sp. CCMP2097]|nr:hypothetical protein M885DRAFT_510174 [Pelagophyceae sp. CCMP2097]
MSAHRGAGSEMLDGGGSLDSGDHDSLVALHARINRAQAEAAAFRDVGRGDLDDDLEHVSKLLRRTRQDRHAQAARISDLENAIETERRRAAGLEAEVTASAKACAAVLSRDGAMAKRRVARADEFAKKREHEIRRLLAFATNEATNDLDDACNSAYAANASE